MPESSQAFTGFTGSAQREGPGILVSAAAGLAACGIVLMFVMIFVAAGRAIFQPEAPSPWIWSWNPRGGEFGILPMIAGSLALSLFALALGWPLALGITVWRLSERRPFFMAAARFCGALLRFMSAIPTVVYGFAAVFLLTPWARDVFGGSGMCLFSAGLMLVLLVLPTMCLVLEAGIRPRLEKLTPWALALGFTQLDLVRLFAIPQSRRTLVAAAILGFGRALGDTLLPLMLAGNAPLAPEGLAGAMRTLTSHMALVTANEVGGAAYNSLFIAGLLLLLANAGASLMLRWLEPRKK